MKRAIALLFLLVHCSSCAYVRNTFYSDTKCTSVPYDVITPVDERCYIDMNGSMKTTCESNYTSYTCSTLDCRAGCISSVVPSNVCISSVNQNYISHCVPDYPLVTSNTLLVTLHNGSQCTSSNYQVGYLYPVGKCISISMSYSVAYTCEGNIVYSKQCKDSICGECNPITKLYNVGCNIDQSQSIYAECGTYSTNDGTILVASYTIFFASLMLVLLVQH